MAKATRSSKKAPAPEPVDQEVLQFRAQFDERSPLDEIVHRGAQEMLQAAINAEVDQFLRKWQGGRRWCRGAFARLHLRKGNPERTMYGTSTTRQVPVLDWGPKNAYPPKRTSRRRGGKYGIR